ncbi:hypothetical protein GCM10010371_03370 [Streptomyces subrutilus]|uniref:Uncharacterized protein n=1 Tax=Streptomyces subrutilus TaxID=36818 RepID=A0A918QGZ4_9ACTN|nr:hypothetical protein GCM10010371_03370 [Streptomyces subrutilus]
MYRIARTRRLLRWGPGGPESTRPSDVNGQDPTRIHLTLDEDGNVVTGSRAARERTRAAAAVGRGREGVAREVGFDDRVDGRQGPAPVEQDRWLGHQESCLPTVHANDDSTAVPSAVRERTCS